MNSAAKPPFFARYGVRVFFWLCVVAVFLGYGVLWAIATLYEVPLEWRAFRFERPWAALLALPLLAVFYTRFATRLQRPRLLVSRGADLARAARSTWRTWLDPLVPVLRLLALGLLVLAVMGPQSIHARQNSEIQGIDIALTLDVSGSMQASDIQPNRFIAMKAVVDEFVRRRPNDRMAAVIFGREAYTLLPLTTDKESLRSVLAELELDEDLGRGTAIGNALGTSLNRLRRSHARTRIIILLTDGESNSGNVSPEQAAEFARNLNVKIYTVLMGQDSNAPVQRGTDWFGRPIMDRGSFPVNPELMRRLAESTGGESYVVSDRQALERSFHSILDTLERSQIEDSGRVYGELFPAFAWPALWLLLLEALLEIAVLRRWP